MLIIITTLAMMHHGMQGLQILDWQMKATAFNVTTLVAFVLLYWLAMLNRRDPSAHAGFMVCTAFPLFTAFVPRLIQGSRPLEHLAISLFGTFAAFGQAALLPADVSALAMSIWDWRFNRRLTIFPVALITLFTIHLSTITFYRISVWKSTVEWFVNVPSP
ncbi:MAG TPA: hypothetical protein VGQ19_14475 [Burkholderiales bacterium]|nr:hypothetical protein [Burkholderiales bacterium]